MPGAARHLAAAAGAQLDVVDDRAGRDVAHRQRVADADVRAVAGLDHVADVEAVGREDVALLAVERSAAGRSGRCGWGRTRCGRPWPARRPCCVGSRRSGTAACARRRGAARSCGPRRCGRRSWAWRASRLRSGVELRELGEVRDRLEAASWAGGFARAECHQILTPRTGRSCCRRPASRSRAWCRRGGPRGWCAGCGRTCPCGVRVLTFVTGRRRPARRRGVRRSSSRRCRPRRRRRARPSARRSSQRRPGGAGTLIDSRISRRPRRRCRRPASSAPRPSAASRR